MRIVVLMGGDSPEREISLASGRAVAEALRRRGHQVEQVDLQRIAQVTGLVSLSESDVVFPALHGGQGEDGHLQALLEILDVPYALSGPLACAMAMNKSAAKRLMRGAGISTPAWLQVTWDRATRRPRALSDSGDSTSARRNQRCTIEHIERRVVDELGYPLVVKPNSLGSSVGVQIVQNPENFTAAFEEAATVSRDVLLEKFIPGRELTATVLLSRRLPLVEIRPRDGFYDYRNKYTPGASEYLVPAPVNSPIYEQISDDALRLFDLMECRGVARVDFRLDGDDYYCLEVNAIPGMTDTSLVPMAAEAVGIGFGALVEDLCRAATVKPPEPGRIPAGDSVRRSR